MDGQIIIVNGTSGSGKTTACELFARQAEDFWLVYGIDHFMGSTFPRAFGHGGARCREGIYAHPLDDSEPEGALRWSITEQGMKAFGVFHEWIATASRQGCNIIVDHLLISDPPILQDCVRRLQDLPVLIVTLKPDYEVLVERIEGREIGRRFANSNLDSEQVRQSKERLRRLRPWFYQAIYANTVCDLEIDTVQHDPASVCAQIQARLSGGPGEALHSLAKQYRL